MLRDEEVLAVDPLELGEIRPRGLRIRHRADDGHALGPAAGAGEQVPRRIAEAGCEGSPEGLAVLEIGPGVGCLTVELAERAEHVAAVELDRMLLPVLAETLAAGA